MIKMNDPRLSSNMISGNSRHLSGRRNYLHQASVINALLLPLIRIHPEDGQKDCIDVGSRVKGISPAGEVTGGAA